MQSSFFWAKPALRSAFCTRHINSSTALQDCSNLIPFSCNCWFSVRGRTHFSADQRGREATTQLHRLLNVQYRLCLFYTDRKLSSLSGCGRSSRAHAADGSPSPAQHGRSRRPQQLSPIPQLRAPPALPPRALRTEPHSCRGERRCRPRGCGGTGRRRPSAAAGGATRGAAARPGRSSRRARPRGPSSRPLASARRRRAGCPPGPGATQGGGREHGAASGAAAGESRPAGGERLVRGTGPRGRGQRAAERPR